MVTTTQYPDTRVLLIERNAQNVSLYKFALDSLAFAEIATAANTEEALDLMYFNQPNLIILGGHLYPKSAEDFAADIRHGKTGAKTDVPIVLISYAKTKTAIEHCRDAGITEILIAPVSVKNLQSRVHVALKHRRDFIASDVYTGPDRRRRELEPVQCKRGKGQKAK